MAGGIAAAVVPIAVIGSAAAGDDAELLELGRRWEAVYRELCAIRPTADASWAKFEEALKPTRRRYRAGEILGEAALAEHARLCEETGADADQSKLEEIYERLDPLSEAILHAPPAHTIRGLAVKARVAMEDVSRYWDKPIRDLDMDQHLYRDLIETICTMAGVPAEPVASSA